MGKHKTFQEDAMDILEGNMDIETLAKVDAGCGDKLTHGLKRGKDIGAVGDGSNDDTVAIQAELDAKGCVNMAHSSGKVLHQLISKDIKTIFNNGEISRRLGSDEELRIGKVFTELPSNIQQAIHKMGVVDGSIDMTGYEAWKRTNGQT